MGFPRVPPLKYDDSGEDVAKFERLILMYFTACKINRSTPKTASRLMEGFDSDELEIMRDIDDKHPTVTGAAMAVGMSRPTWIAYEKRDSYSAIIKRAKDAVESYNEQKLHEGKCAGVIFNLKNNFGWRDQQDVNHSGNLTITEKKYSFARKPEAQNEDEDDED